MDILNILKYGLEIVDDSLTTKELIDQLVSIGPLQEPLHLTELDNVVKRHYQWLRHLPRVHPYYTVRSNNDARILGTTVLLDCGYICSSKAEVMQIMELGVEPEWILLKDAAKTTELLKFARRKRLTVVFEHEQELRQIHQHYPEAEILVRFGFNTDSSLEHDSHIKTHELLNIARDLELDVIGWCFNGGASFRHNDGVVYEAIRKGREISDFALILGFNFRFINLEASFTGEQDNELQEYSTRINRALAEFFPDRWNLTVTAESGPFLSAAAVTAVSAIHGKRVFWHRQFPSQIDRVFYYLNHDIGGDQGQKQIKPIIWKSLTDCGAVCQSSLFASSNECMLENLPLPEVNEMDFFVFENQGASLSDLTELQCTPIVLVFVRKSMWDFLETLSVSNHPKTCILSSQYLQRVAKIERLRFE
ncbi:ornithine decarboxylase-like [Ochlerotatus camptorhynchus]|uniref:ornithine decarboxylase-like n=1 Tax=Ochlerotatus camptorhynchus TaxID=644619 RepID=UPI0031CFC142